MVDLTEPLVSEAPGKHIILRNSNIFHYITALFFKFREKITAAQEKIFFYDSAQCVKLLETVRTIALNGSFLR